MLIGKKQICVTLSRVFFRKMAYSKVEAKQAKENNMSEYDEDFSEKWLRQPQQRPTGPTRRPGCGMLAMTVVISLLCGALGAGGVLLGYRTLSGTGTERVPVLEGLRENAVIETVPMQTGERMTAAQVYAANVHATVGITTSVSTNFWGFQSTSAASGSGFVISANGYILTNHHVIASSDKITVTLYSGQTHEAQVVGYDENNDIAVLKVDAAELTPVILGDSDNLNIGDDVLAIGNPLGELTFSLTAGKISAKDREVTFSNGVMMNLLQTDCAINSGNSGGALFNLYGEVIGVTNAKYSGGTQGTASIDNIGFAIPLNSIKGIVESIIEKGYASKPYIGVAVTDTPQEYQFYGLPQGATVRNVEKGSPAEQADLQPGDIITQIDDQVLTGSRELVRYLRKCTAGQTLQLKLYRKGETLEVSLTVEERNTTEQS